MQKKIKFFKKNIKKFVLEKLLLQMSGAGGAEDIEGDKISEDQVEQSSIQENGKIIVYYY